MDDLLIYRIDSVLKNIDLVLKDAENVSLQELENSSLLLRATCFSISQIGEMMVQLEKHLSEKYTDLPWKESRKMRNIIVHDYGNADIEQIYSTIHIDLPILKQRFIEIRKEVLRESMK